MASAGKAAADTPTKLSKSERKLAKKQAKACHTLLKHDGIHTVTSPTSIMLVANGGLGNGIQRSEILSIFSSVGPVEDVVMLREKPYCFVKYGDKSLATAAMHRLHGHCLREGQGPDNVTLYLSFVESVPADKPKSNEPPPGLISIPDFIDESLEQKLIEGIDWESPTDIVNQSLKHRKVKHHGYEFNYSTNNVDRDRPLPGGMPELYGQVIDRIMETGHVQFKPDQLTINQYQPGQGIPPHVDTHSAFEDAIISLSLGSQVVMEFTHPEGHQIPVVLPRRCLLIMTGEARYKWTHGITPKKTDVIPDPTSPNNLTLHQRGQRTSFTFRAVRGRPCDCKYPEQCDSQKSKVGATTPPQVVYPKSEEEAAKLEAEQVHVVYNNIAQHFSGTRYKPWPKVVDFLKGLDPGSVVLDVGCGNGKYLGVNKKLHMIGCDRSNQLIDICRARGLEGLVCDSLALPFGDGRMDACICIAVIHHMSTRVRRLQALREITRVLSHGGLALVTVWAMEQEHKKEKSKYISKKVEAGMNNSNCSSEDDGGNLTNETKTCSNPSDGRENKKCDLSYEARELIREESESGTDEKRGCTTHAAIHRRGLCASSSNRISHKPGNVSSHELGHDSRDLPGCSSERLNHQDPDLETSSNLSSEDASTHHTFPQRSQGVNSRIGDDHDTDVRSGIAADNDVRSRPCEKNSISSEEQAACSAGDDQPISHTESSSLQHSAVDGVSSLNKEIAENLPGETILVHKNRTLFEQQDLLVPWHLRGQASKVPDNPIDDSKSKDKEKEKVFFRYYHVFVQGEMEELCQTIPGVRVKDTYYDQGNWCVIFQKLR